jgi:hypothetical protein
MNFDHRHYVPCIRWKQGEYQAILRLSDDTKDIITPLIEVPEIGFDFEEEQPKKSIDGHLKPFAKRVATKWKGRPCFVDLKLIKPSERMADGQHPVTFVFDDLRALRCVATPVTALDRDTQYQMAVKEVTSEDKYGVCVRLTIEEAVKSNVKSLIDMLLAQVGVNAANCDLVLDLGAPSFEPLAGFAKLIVAATGKLPHLSRWRTFTLIGTSFPESMARIRQSPERVQRFEWQVYKLVVAALTQADMRLPTFGDYAINHPVVLDLDMRLVKPSATIRYTIDDEWLIIKGRNVRENGFEQYRDLCATLVALPQYAGRQFSYGDAYISRCSSGTESTGNLTIWRKVGSNHHFEKVVRDVSSFFVS